jgi:hypothetical protein
MMRAGRNYRAEVVTDYVKKPTRKTNVGRKVVKRASKSKPTLKLK